MEASAQYHCPQNGQRALVFLGSQGRVLVTSRDNPPSCKFVRTASWLDVDVLDESIAAYR
jgi:hypothetical protein